MFTECSTARAGDADYIASDNFCNLSGRRSVYLFALVGIADVIIYTNYEVMSVFQQLRLWCLHPQWGGFVLF